MRKSKDIVLYKSSDGSIKLDVQLEEETVWLSLNQLSDLFGRDKSVISRHLRNIFKEKELDRDATVAKNATVQNEGGRTVSRDIEFFNLDAIISVGYRVNSKRGTEFRIWATNVLKQHLVKGYSVNEKRLKALNQVVRLTADISRRKLLSGDEATALLQTISEYSFALDLLDDYDHQRVTVGKTSKREAKPVDHDEVMALIQQMRIKFGDSAVFGKEKDQVSIVHSMQ